MSGNEMSVGAGRCDESELELPSDVVTSSESAAELPSDLDTNSEQDLMQQYCSCIEQVDSHRLKARLRPALAI